MNKQKAASILRTEWGRWDLVTHPVWCGWYSANTNPEYYLEQLQFQRTSYTVSMAVTDIKIPSLSKPESRGKAYLLDV